MIMSTAGRRNMTITTMSTSAAGRRNMTITTMIMNTAGRQNMTIITMIMNIHRSSCRCWILTNNEGALIGTVRCRITGEYAQVTEELEKAVKDLAEEIDRQGGIVGHIKAFVKEENRSCMLSLTEPGEVHRIPADNPAVLAEIANIIFGLSEEEFHKCLVQAYGRWLQ